MLYSDDFAPKGPAFQALHDYAEKISSYTPVDYLSRFDETITNQSLVISELREQTGMQKADLEQLERQTRTMEAQLSESREQGEAAAQQAEKSGKQSLLAIRIAILALFVSALTLLATVAQLVVSLRR